MKKLLKSVPITEKELEVLAALAKRLIWSKPEIRKKMQTSHKVNITPANFYSNIPLVEDIENSFEFRDGRDKPIYDQLFDSQELNTFAESLLEYAHEFAPAKDGVKENPEGYFWNNPAFSYLDAMSYYCMVRRYKPKFILEIGAGFSTLVASQAMQKNGFGEIKIIEPFPMQFLRNLPHVTEIFEKFVQDIPLDQAIRLVEEANLWFIDSTHTVKIGSDCLYIYLKMMPEVQSAKLVHSHDIYLPFGMPKFSALDKHIYWTEQYLLYAYLLKNESSRILFGSAYCQSQLPEIGSRLMDGKHPVGGASFWYTLNNFT